MIIINKLKTNLIDIKQKLYMIQISLNIIVEINTKQQH